MRKTTVSCWAAGLILAGSMVGMLAGEARAADPAGGVGKELQGITKPSGDVTPAFVRPGLVQDVTVKKGDRVSAGQVIARLEDKAEQAELALAKEQAESTAEVEAEQKVLDKDKVDLEQFQTHGGSPSEILDKQLAVEVDKARVVLANEKQKQAGLSYDKTKAELERMKVVSPIDGVVEDILLKQGEAADSGSMKLMRIVQVDPLWVEVPVPILPARTVKLGDEARITFSDKTVRSGKVVNIASVADPASETMTIRIEVPNPDRLSAGEFVVVNFVSGVAAR